MAEVDPLIGQTVGQYKIQSLIAVGRRGRIYRADHAVMGRPCAIKFIRPELKEQDRMVERFRREVRIGSRLEHRNIIAFHDAGLHGDEIFLVMEYFPGHSLVERFQKRPAPPRVVADIGAQAAAALSVAHEAGVVHREMEPSNILLNDDGLVKVLDFGIAKAYQDSQPKDLTDPVELLGEPSYMAPEQVWGADRISKRADIYGLGAVLYFCLTGRPPYTGSDPMEIVQQIGSEFPRPSDLREGIPPELDAAVLRAMNPDMDKRFSDATAMAGVLRRIADGMNALAAPEAPVAPAPATPAAPPPSPNAATKSEEDTSASYDPIPARTKKGGKPSRGPIPYLRVFGPQDGCWEHNLGKEKVVIGRAEDADLELVESAVSRYHAVIRPTTEGGYIVQDNESRAGVFVNGIKTTRAVLSHGDSIQIAHYVLQYREDQKYVSAEGRHFPLHFLPTSMKARYRVVYYDPAKVFAPGDTLPVGQGGIFLPIDFAPPDTICVEVELTWPGGRRRTFLAEILGTLPHEESLLVCLKLHQIPREMYEHIIRRSRRDEWAVVRTIE